MSDERLLQRFLRYVVVDTTADESASIYPSCEGQLELGRQLVAELQAMGLENAHQNAHGLVLATLAGNTTEPLPTIVWNAHLDTSPETTGKDVKPQVWRDYQGGDLALPADPDQVIRVAENRELDALHGCTLITTDGTTLLGADDKAGLAVIMEAAQRLLEQPALAHGEIRLLFTCDEEIGRGVQHVDIQALSATACYTLDGSGAGMVDVETFSADLVTAVLRGHNIHPSIAKDRMVNAVRAAGHFLDRLPRDRLSPETTDQREGFLHPYTLEGGVGRATIKILLRDFDTPRLDQHFQCLEQIAAQTQQTFPGLQIELQRRRQYRNLGDGLRKEPRAAEYAENAYRRLGHEPRRTMIRGGTDGSLLSELGLPTPNLSTGQHNPHSTLEWTCLEEMERACRWLVELAQEWARKEAGGKNQGS